MGSANETSADALLDFYAVQEEEQQQLLQQQMQFLKQLQERQEQEQKEQEYVDSVKCLLACISYLFCCPCLIPLVDYMSIW